MWRCVLIDVYCGSCNIISIDYSCLYILIMFDVKLTPSGCSVERRLFIWMGRRRVGLISISLFGECSRIAGAIYVGCLFRVLDRLWSRTTSFIIFWIYLCCGYFAHISGFEYFIYGCTYELTTWPFKVYAIFPLWCFIVEIFMHVNWELFEGVTSISWIIVIFAYFIALIEVRRYSIMWSKEKFIKPRPNESICHYPLKFIKLLIKKKLYNLNVLKLTFKNKLTNSRN